MKQSHSETARLCRALGLLLRGGVSLSEGLFLLAQEESGPCKDALTAAARQMDRGCPLAEALEAAGLFPAYALGLIRVGEKTGRTEEALLSLADHYAQWDRTRRQVRSALAYPAVVLALLLVVLAVLLVQVLPVFDRVYASLGSGLTGLAGSLLSLGRGLTAAAPWIFGMLVLLAGFLLALRFLPDLRHRLLQLWRTRFGDRGPARRFNDARFLQALSMGIRSGLPAEEAAALGTALLADIPQARCRCQACAKALEEGCSLSEALAGLLSPARCRLLSAALRSGAGDQALEQLALEQMEEARHSLESLLGSIEPALVLAASLLVGSILLAVMLPLADILSLLG